MSTKAFYHTSDGIVITPPLNSEQKNKINQTILDADQGRFPWDVCEGYIDTPDDAHGVCYYGKEDDANVLAWVIELILKENPDADIEGIVHISWDDDDSMTKLVVHDSYVLESYRLNVFSEPNSVTAWKPEKVDNATN